MAHFWVTWNGRGPATINAPTKEEARTLGEVHGVVKDVLQLPYPRRPQLNQEEGGCPSFCFGDNECFDRTSCPRRRACDD